MMSGNQPPCGHDNSGGKNESISNSRRPRSTVRRHRQTIASDGTQQQQKQPPSIFICIVLAFVIMVCLQTMEMAKFQANLTQQNDISSSLDQAPPPLSANNNNNNQTSTSETKQQQSNSIVEKIPLEQLTLSTKSSPNDCTKLTTWYDNKIIAPSKSKKKKIPNIIHQTTKSRCIYIEMPRILNQWRELKDYNYFLHDDEALWRLIRNREWPEFPHLVPVLDCLESMHMTAVADVWRYLVLWEYGGIYVDLDAAPANWTAAHIDPQDDAYFVVEHYDSLSQYFMAVSPRHPLMFYAVHQALHKVMNAIDPGKIDASTTTGPSALFDAFQFFMLDAGQSVEKPIRAGVYRGQNGRSLRVDGKGRLESDDIIKREAIRRIRKSKMYSIMNMTHFREDTIKYRRNPGYRVSCFLDMYGRLYHSNDKSREASRLHFDDLFSGESFENNTSAVKV